MITHEQVTEILVKLAQIDERQKAMDEAGDHRHNNLKMSLEGLASKKDVEQLDRRVSALESTQSRVFWAIGGTVGAVFINILGLGKKLGF